MYANPAPTTNMAYGSQGPVQGQYKMQGYQSVQPEQGYQPVQPAFAPMMQQQQQQGPSVILVQQQAPNLYRQPVYENMSRQQLIVSGVLQIIVGSLSFAINIMSRVVGSSLSVIGIGFWAGVMVSLLRQCYNIYSYNDVMVITTIAYNKLLIIFVLINVR